MDDRVAGAVAASFWVLAAICASLAIVGAWNHSPGAIVLGVPLAAAFAFLAQKVWGEA